MATEDFTFPIISDSFPCCIDSPPLWRASPTTPCHEEATTTSNWQHQDGEDGCFGPNPADYARRKSFSYIERGGRRARGDGSEENEEERMDMLWEDFNEELRKKRGSMSSSSSSSVEMAEMGCVKVLATTPGSGCAVVATRKAAGLVVFVKVLRKFFQLHQSHSSPPKRHAFRPH